MCTDELRVRLWGVVNGSWWRSRIGSGMVWLRGRSVLSQRWLLPGKGDQAPSRRCAPSKFAGGCAAWPPLAAARCGTVSFTSALHNSQQNLGGIPKFKMSVYLYSYASSFLSSYQCEPFHKTDLMQRRLYSFEVTCCWFSGRNRKRRVRFSILHFKDEDVSVWAIN